MKFKRDRLVNRFLHMLFPRKKVYSTFSWKENFLGGHVTIGSVTIFGENAMQWAVNINTRFGFVCFRLPFRCFDKWWPLYFYVSKNGTPSNAEFWLYGRQSSGY